MLHETEIWCIITDCSNFNTFKKWRCLRGWTLRASTHAIGREMPRY